MASTECLSSEGFRLDGRRTEEIRHLSIKIGNVSFKADGSAMVQIGRTKVISYIHGPYERSASLSSMNEMQIHCSFNAVSFKGLKTLAHSNRNRVCIDNAATIKDTFTSIIQTDKYCKSDLYIYICVLEDDGGILPAAINATMVSLIDAGIPVKDIVTSVSVGLLGHSSPLVDLNQEEARSAAAELVVAIHRRSRLITSLNLNSKISIDKLDEMSNLATSACGEIARIIENSIRDHLSQLYMKIHLNS